MLDPIAILARVIVGAVLLLAGIAKVRSRTWSTFAVEMKTPKLVVIVLPAVEAILGLALILQFAGQFAAGIAASLFLAFTVVVISRYAKGSDLPCNCFGGDGPITKLTILRNICLLALAIVGTAA